MRPFFVIASVLIGAASASASAGAQPPTEGFTLDATAGVNTGKSNARRVNTHGGLSFAITAATRPNPARVLTYAASLDGRGQMNEDCIVEVGVPRGCRPEIPGMVSFSLLGGASRTWSVVGARFLVGPAVYRGDVHSRVGAQAHADLTIGARHIALVIGARGNIVPQPGGEVYRLFSQEFGLRLR